MLTKILSKFPRRAKAAPPNMVRVRRAHQPTGRKEPVAVDHHEGAAEVLRPAIASVHDEHAPIEVTSETMLPSWRGILSDVVRDQEQCVVLDLSFRSVMVLGTPEFFGGPSHGALVSSLRSKNFSVDSEKTTTKEVIAAVRAKAERALQSQLGARVETDAANVQLYKDLLSGAHALRGSDLHMLLDLDSGRTNVRLRVDGISRKWRTFDTPVLNAALAAGYQSLSIRGTNSNPDWTLDRPINTITRFNDGETVIHGRLTTQTVTGGAKVVIRVSDGSFEDIENETLHDSGFTDEQINQQILPALRRKKGFLIIGGSTGAGKTVSLQRMMMALPGREGKEIMAVEDPNERRIPGVAHHSIQRNTDDSPERIKVLYDSAFLTQMRMDPDVIMVGEIRDRTSADLATDAVLTGHLLAVTMHGNSALGQLFRLMNPRIGMDPEVLADEENFVMSMAQCLVPTLCKHCRVPAHEVMHEKDLSLLRSKWKLDTRKMFCASGTGCPHCTPDGLEGNGEKGRIGAFEIITKPTEAFLDCLRNRDRKGAELAWRQTRRAGFDSPDMLGKTQFENALYHVSQGIVSPLALPIEFGKEFDEISVVEVAEGLRLAAERAA